MTQIVYNPSEIDFAKPGKHHYQLAFQMDGNWGSSLIPITVINGSKGPAEKNVVAFGGTHGNEYEGQVSVKRLCQDLDPATMRGRVILIPQLSQSACVANRRVSPLDGVNMNRAFPGNPRGTISYRISNFVKMHIFPQVHAVIDIHSGGNEAIYPLCSSFHPIADPQQRAEIAQVARLFVVSKCVGHSRTAPRRIASVPSRRCNDVRTICMKSPVSAISCPRSASAPNE